MSPLCKLGMIQLPNEFLKNPGYKGSVAMKLESPLLEVPVLVYRAASCSDISAHLCGAILSLEQSSDDSHSRCIGMFNITIC